MYPSYFDTWNPPFLAHISTTQTKPISCTLKPHTGWPTCWYQGTPTPLRTASFSAGNMVIWDRTFTCLMYLAHTRERTVGMPVYQHRMQCLEPAALLPKHLDTRVTSHPNRRLI